MSTRCLLAALLTLAAVPLSAQPARVVDINPGGADAVQGRGGPFLVYGPDNVNRAPFDRNRFVTLNGEAYFFANDGATGQELWRTDGTAEGTARATDLAPGATSSVMSTPVRFRGALYVTASALGNNSDRALYRFDGFEAALISDRDLLPVGSAADAVFLRDSDGAGYVLGTCDPDGSGGPLCAFEPFVDQDGRGLPAPVVVRQGGAFYFATTRGMYRSLLTGPTTRLQFPSRTTGNTNVIGGVGRPYRAGGYLLFTCFFSRERQTATNPGDVQGVELCRSLGGIDDVALMEDLNPGPDSPDLSIVGVYGGDLYAVARDPADRSDFLLFRTDGTAWTRVSANNREFYRNTTANDVFMLEAGGVAGHIAERARTDAQFPETELALFRSDGSRVTTDGEGWRTVRTAGGGGRGYFAAEAQDRTVALYQWDGADTVTEIGPLPGLPTVVKAYGGGVVMDAGGELWAYNVGRPSQRRAVSALGAATFALSRGDDAFPFTLDVSALGAGGEVQAAALRVDEDSLAVPAPAEATALLGTFVRATAGAGVSGIEATVTVSYSDADLAASGVRSEGSLAVWKTDGAGGWTQLPIVARDPAANTITAGPFAGLSDFVVGSTTPVATDGGAPGSPVLLVVFPNPAASAASVTVTLAEPADAEVTIHDALGRRVAVVHRGPLGAGAHRIGADVSAWPAGVYVVRAVVGARADSRRMVVVR